MSLRHGITLQLQPPPRWVWGANFKAFILGFDKEKPLVSVYYNITELRFNDLGSTVQDRQNATWLWLLVYVYSSFNGNRVEKWYVSQKFPRPRKRSNKNTDNGNTTNIFPVWPAYSLPFQVQRCRNNSSGWVYHRWQVVYKNSYSIQIYDTGHVHISIHDFTETLSASLSLYSTLPIVGAIIPLMRLQIYGRP